MYFNKKRFLCQTILINFFLYFFFNSICSFSAFCFYFSSFLGVIFFILFSSLLLLNHTCLPHSIHFILKSIPVLAISNLLLPHGCCFFNSTISPTFNSIGIKITLSDIYYPGNIEPAACLIKKSKRLL